MGSYSLSALAFVVLSCGCAAGGLDVSDPAQPPTTDPTSYPTLEDFCAGRAKAECSDAVVKACGAKSASECLAARTNACMSSAPQGTTFQPSNAPACIAAIKTIYAKTVITDAEIADLGTTCGTKIFSGPGVARAPC